MKPRSPSYHCGLRGRTTRRRAGGSMPTVMAYISSCEMIFIKQKADSTLRSQVTGLPGLNSGNSGDLRMQSAVAVEVMALARTELW
ncbi:hypothetical protein MRX96_000977 [Rhipicephalus microplus]